MLVELAVFGYDWASAAVFLDRPATSIRHGMFPKGEPFLGVTSYGEAGEAELLDS